MLPLARAHPGLSGIAAIANGPDAFAARVLLADAADRSLDVQYYVWHKDMTGTLLFDAIRRAADRGVRVRLLLDDNNTRGLDPLLAAFTTTIPERSYRVRLGADGLLQWVDRQNDSLRVYGQEPGTGFWRLLTVMIMSILPIEWLL